MVSPELTWRRAATAAFASFFCAHSTRMRAWSLLTAYQRSLVYALSQVATRHKAIKLTPDNEDDLLLCKGFTACHAAGVLISEACACCRSCSNQIMWNFALSAEALAQAMPFIMSKQQTKQCAMAASGCFLAILQRRCSHATSCIFSIPSGRTHHHALLSVYTYIYVQQGYHAELTCTFANLNEGR